MNEVNMKGKISKKTVTAIVLTVVIVALAALTGAIAGHAVYQNDSEALIVDFGSMSQTSDNGLTYVYDDGVKSIDFSKEIEVSKGATFFIKKVINEDKTVLKGEGTCLDVSEEKHRRAVVTVVSKNGKGNTDYDVTVYPKSVLGNTIELNTAGAKVEGDTVITYTGAYDIDLPTPTKNYLAPSGNEYEYDFLGWYSTPDYEEGTEVASVEAGRTGEVNLYAKFADNAAPVVKDGYTYVTFGSYPRTQVTDFKLYNEIKRSDAFKNVSSGSKFTYNGQTYYKFVPANVPNLSANGYSTTSTYVFTVEPVEWRVLTAKGVTPSGTVTLLSNEILNCSAYSTNDETLIKSLYNTLSTNKLVSSMFDLSRFMRFFFDGDSVYGTEGTDENPGTWDTILKLIKIKIESNDLRRKMDSMVGDMFNGTEQSKIVTKVLNRYKLLEDGTESYNCQLFPLNYSDTVNASYGFYTDYRYNDPLRKAMVTDFAAANGVYISQNLAHRGQGSWWLRSAGGTQGMEYGDATRGYGYKDKRVCYVKYTGYVHAYGSLNNNIRSGVRPAVMVNYGSVIS